MWRQSGGQFDLGIRAGIGGRSGDRTVLVGAEFAGDLVTRGQAQPFGVSWLVGAGDPSTAPHGCEFRPV
jgi:hypothetical protein